MTIPLNAGELTLEVMELFSGESSTLRLKVQPQAGAADLTAFEAGEPVPAERGGQPTHVKWSPVEVRFGPHVRDVTLTDGGSLAVLNTMNWDHNLYALDTKTGEVRWRQRAGQYFAFDPQPMAKELAVQGFDFESAEGYHLYV